MSFSERLRISRREAGLSQEQLAEELNVSRQSITKWEAGNTYPEVKTLIMLAARLDRELDWLLYDELSDSQMEQVPWEERRHRIQSVYNKDTLREAMKTNILLRLLETLDGYEFTEHISTDQFVGTKTCIFLNQRVFVSLEGTDPQTKEDQESFSELSPDELEDLFPWIWHLRKKIPCYLR